MENLLLIVDRYFSAELVKFPKKECSVAKPIPIIGIPTKELLK